MREQCGGGLVSRIRAIASDLLAFPCSLKNKFAALESEEEEDEEEVTKEKEPPKQGKEKAKKAEQVCVSVLGEVG